MSVYSWIIAQNGDISQRQPFNLQVPTAGTDEHPPSEKEIAGLCLLHVERAALIQAPRKHLSESLWHVLHHDNAARKIMRQLGEDVLQGLRAPGGNSNGHDFRRLSPVGGFYLLPRHRPRQIRWDSDGARPAMRSRLNLGD